jgi:hypothetical protein
MGRDRKAGCATDGDEKDNTGTRASRHPGIYYLSSELQHLLAAPRIDGVIHVIPQKLPNVQSSSYSSRRWVLIVRSSAKLPDP